MGISFEGRLAIVTGAGGGLGRQHALALAARGAKVVAVHLMGAVVRTHAVWNTMHAKRYGRVVMTTSSSDSSLDLLTHGMHLGSSADAPERVAAHFAEVSSRAGETVPDSGGAQGLNEVAPAMAAAR